MGLVTGITRRVEVPNEPDAWMKLAMLSAVQLDIARQARFVALAKQLKALEGVTLPSSAQAVTDPLTSYDRQLLLKMGVLAWSYGDTVDPDNLDERTAEWAAREVLRLAVPEQDEVFTRPSLSIAT